MTLGPNFVGAALMYDVTNDQSNHFRKQERAETVMQHTTTNRQSIVAQQHKDSVPTRANEVSRKSEVN